VDHQGVEFVAALTQQVAGTGHCGTGQEVGFGGAGGGSHAKVQAVGRQSGAEQTGQLAEQTLAVQFVDGIGQLVADVKHGVFTSREHCDVVHRVSEAAMADGGHLGGGADLLKGSDSRRCWCPRSRCRP